MNTIFETMKLRDHLKKARDSHKTFCKTRRFSKHGRELLIGLEAGHKIMSCGNGGSMCDAMHFAEELSGRYRAADPIAAMSLSDASVCLASGTTTGSSVFSRQVEALGNPETCSWPSAQADNLERLEAARAAKEGVHVLALTGNDGGALARWPMQGSGALVWVRRPHPRNASSASMLGLTPSNERTERGCSNVGLRQDEAQLPVDQS